MLNFPVKPIVATKLLAALAAKRLRTLGGPGSGNFGHAGRPGEIGGSAPAGDFGAVFGRHPSNIVSERKIGDKNYQIVKQGEQTYSLRDSLSDKEIAHLIVRNDGSVRDFGVSRGEQPSRELREYLLSTVTKQQPDFDPDRDYLGVGARVEMLIRKHGVNWLDALVKEQKTGAFRGAGGAGSGNFGHAGRPGEIGGSASGGVVERDLAHPAFVIGDGDMPGGAGDYIAKYGQEFTAQSLPKGVRQGKLGECYRNASLAVMSDENLTYAEGYASQPEDLPGITFMHAWAVDKAGNVVDPTWPHPERNTYFGVKYDREAYLAHIIKAEFYGVLGGDWSSAQHAISTDGKALRALGGPGSGNFGHAGRPGEVGGSASESSAPIVVTEALNRLQQQGVKTVKVEDFPPQLTKTWTSQMGSISNSVAVPEPVVTGVVNGIEELKGTTAGAALDRARVAFIDYDHDAMATTATNMPVPSIVVINGHPRALANGIDRSLEKNTIAGQMAGKSGLSGDAYQREMYKYVAIHEAGHVVDGHVGGQYSDALVSELVYKFQPTEIERVLRKVSPYALSSPHEAFAEVFTATVAGKEIFELMDFQQTLRESILSK